MTEATNNTSALLPCPFCGSTDVEIDGKPAILDALDSVSCNQCTAGAPIHAWQGRTTPPAAAVVPEKMLSIGVDATQYGAHVCLMVKGSEGAVQVIHSQFYAARTDGAGSIVQLPVRDLYTAPPAAAVVMPPSPYMPDVDPENLTDYERGEAQGRCDMWTEVARLNPAPDHSEHALGMVPADHVEHVRAMVVPEGWRLVPVEPTEAMIDVTVSYALMVILSGDYNWSAYMRDVWLSMLAAAPTPEQPAKEVQ